MKEIKAFQCGFCRKCFARKSNCGQHEAGCRNNPAKRHCITCVHGVNCLTQSEPDATGYQYDAPLPFCDKHGKALWEAPYMLDCDVNQVGCWASDAAAGLAAAGIPCSNPYSADYEEPVPWTCNHYEYKGFAGWGKLIISEIEDIP